MIMYDHATFVKTNKRLLFYKAHGEPNEYAIHLNLNRHLYHRLKPIAKAITMQEIFLVRPEIVDWFNDNNIAFQKYEIVYRYFVIHESQNYRITVSSYFDSILQLESTNDLMRFKLAWAE